MSWVYLQILPDSPRFLTLFAYSLPFPHLLRVRHASSADIHWLWHGCAGLGQLSLSRDKVMDTQPQQRGAGFFPRLMKMLMGISIELEYALICICLDCLSCVYLSIYKHTYIILYICRSPFSNDWKSNWCFKFGICGFAIFSGSMNHELWHDPLTKLLSCNHIRNQPSPRSARSNATLRFA